MYEQEEFFSRKHDRLLNIAAWANGLVWVVIGWFILAGSVGLLQNVFTIQPAGHLALDLEPYTIARSVIDLSTSLLRGVIYALVLKGISLGLNMIVETDINYREARSETGGAE